MSQSKVAVGERIARARRRRGLSQVERGRRRVDSYSVLNRLADVLHVDIEELTGPTADGREAGQHVYEPAAEIEQAMMHYDAVASSIGGQERGQGGDRRHLREMARSAYQSYQATRYDDTGHILPALIRETEAASRTTGLDDPGMSQIRAMVYDTVAALLNRVGETSLAWAAADRAMSAAELSGNPVQAAASAWRLSHVIGGRKHPGEALSLAMSAAAALERAMRNSDADALSVYGVLHLSAANAAAAVYDRATTESLLARAREIAELTGEGNRMGTAFGHANVAIHSVAAAIQFGDARTAIATGEALDVSALPVGCTGRRTQLSLDLARAYAMRRQDAAAVNMLLAAERLSPQLVRYDARTQDVILTLLGREHRQSTPELRPLAHRAGAV